jgi:hypothetical protein
MSYRHLYTVVAHKRPVMVLCYNVETGEDEVLPLFNRELEAWLGSELQILECADSPGTPLWDGNREHLHIRPATEDEAERWRTSYSSDLRDPPDTWSTHLVPRFPTSDRSLPGSSRCRDNRVDGAADKRIGPLAGRHAQLSSQFISPSEGGNKGVSALANPPIVRAFRLAVAAQSPYFTLGDAAKQAGISKPTLSKAIKNGRLSAEKQPNGSYRIQPTELFRIFPPADRLASYQIAELQERLALLTAERERERHQLMDQIMDLRRRLDAEAEEHRRLSLIVTDQRPRRRWWQFRRND